MTVRHKFVCWLDLETTGLEPMYDPIIETAFVLTGPVYPFKKFDSFSATTRMNPLIKDRLTQNDYVSEMHTASGLLEEMTTERTATIAHVENWAINHLAQWGEPGDFLLGGSGIRRLDMPMMALQMPGLYEWFRPEAELDVGQVRRAFEYAGREDLLATDTSVKVHRALPDAKDHLREYQVYARLLREEIGGA